MTTKDDETLKLPQGRRATSVDVARMAQVTHGTVSRTINKPHAVAPETRKRVLAAMKTLNYMPSATARGLVRGRNSVIGFLTHEAEAFPQRFGLLVLGITEVIGSAKYRLMLDTFRPGGDPNYRPTMISEHLCDGIVIDVESDSGDLMNLCEDLHIPHVFVNPPSHHPNDSVMIDDKEMPHIAIEYLISKGHKNIAYVPIVRKSMGGHPWSTEGRLRGYELAMYRAGLKPFPYYNLPVPYPEERYIEGTPEHYARAIELYGERLDELLGAPEPVTAIVAYSRSMSFHLMEAALQRNLTIPDDISFISCGDGFQPEITPIPLTGVAVDLKDMGIKAANMLLEKIKNPNKKLPNQMIHGKLVERTSVRTLH